MHGTRHPSRHILIQSSRRWRRGIRTFIVTNSSEQEAARLSEENRAHHETYAHSPDEVYRHDIKPCEKSMRAIRTYMRILSRASVFVPSPPCL